MMSLPTSLIAGSDAPPSMSTSSAGGGVMMESDAVDDYASAKKLVVRAANRENLLKQCMQSAISSEEVSSSSGALGADFSQQQTLRVDHMKRPCWVCPDGTIYLEAFHELYAQAYDFLVAIAEPVARPEFIHEYRLTPYSLYAAVATSIDTDSILRVLSAFSKTALPPSVSTFIQECTKRYGKAKLVLKHNLMYVESDYPEVLRELLRDPLIAQARVMEQQPPTNQPSGTTTTMDTNVSTTLTNNANNNHNHTATGTNSSTTTNNITTATSKNGIKNSIADHGFVEFTKALEMEENLHILNIDNEDDTDDGEDNKELNIMDDSELYQYLLQDETTTPIINQDDPKQSVSTANKATTTTGDLTSKSKNPPLLSTATKANSSHSSNNNNNNKKRRKTTATTVAFQIKSECVEVVKKQAIELDYPLMEEYDFRNDKRNPNLPIDLKPHTRIRRYQERSLAKMFGNGNARSGIVVLPCGAGKTLTAVTAAQTIKKSTICLCTNSVSVLQFKYQFKLWTNIPDDRIAVFTSDIKDEFHKDACLLITTYTMVSFGGKRSDKSAQVMDAIRSREWGLMLMDEVHVVPAKMFRRVVGSVKAHCRIGLTATLVREDDLISDLNFLIGPKLYEANWMDLTAQGYLANVQCVEVWCPMVGSFMKEYLTTASKNSRLKQLLYVMNPTKLRTTQFLVNFHEDRGDKIIIFSDVVFSLKLYASMLQRPVIYGETSEKERQAILGTFRTSDKLRTICLSKVGDTSIDLPEANVIIQVSSHFGSRRQEAQRLGRILRPKSSTSTDGSNRSSFNAFFYTLVSTDTQEMFYSSKRQQYLIDQGYTFKVCTNLAETAEMEARINNYAYSRPEDDRELLRKVLTSDLEMEREQRAEDNAIRKNNADGAALADAAASVRRVTGTNLATLSGGGTGMRYREISTATGSTMAKRHPLFKKRVRR